MARTTNGRYLIADLNDTEGAYVSASLPQTEFSNTNENQTVYSLFPYELNDVPIFTNNLYESSEPQIVSEQSYTPSRDNLYYDSSGTVRVVAGSSFKLVVLAQQPNVLNVENGIPIIKPANGDLRYEWLVDGNLVFDVEPSFLDRRVDQRRSLDNVLEFVNVTKRMQGTYTCTVTNDIGQVTSEDVAIEVLDPMRTDDPFAPFNRKNAIQNGFALDSTNNWTAMIGDLATKPMLTKDQETAAKRPNASVFGHSPNEIYPHPINLRTNSIRGFTPADLLKQNAAYFTRGPLQYIANGGTNQAAMYQDVDLSEITDYISGRAYGSKGVRAYFGCVLGNAITRFIPTIDILGPDERNKEEFYYSNAPRISYENFVLAGPAFLEEVVTVIVQEYEGETPLQSTIYEDGEERLVDNIQIVDALSSLYKQTQADPVQPPVSSVKTGDNDTITLKPIEGGQAQVLNLYKSLYPNKQEHYAYGQYAEYKDFVISKLNTRTNKIRITVRFDISTTRINEIAPDIIANDLFDLEIWRKPYIKLLFKEYRKSVLSVFQQNQGSQYKDRPLGEQIRPGNSSHAMATGLGLILEPITPTTQGISGFKGSLINTITKEEEVRPEPIDIYTSQITFEDAASNITGLSTILDIQGIVYISFYRKFENAGWWGFRDGQRDNHDEDDINGRIRITDITTNTLIYDTLAYASEGTVSVGKGTDQEPAYTNFAGEHIIRIEVQAFGGDGWKRKVFPYLTVELANELSEYTGEVGPGRLAHLWPAPVTQYEAPISRFADGTPNTDIGRPGTIRRMGMYPREAYNESVRKFQVDIPSNQIAAIYAGVRYWGPEPGYGSGAVTTEDTVTAKIDFGSTGLVYFRTPKIEYP
jgi:hypothetical protein